MNISDEPVEAALVAFRSIGDGADFNSMRSALEAAAPYLMAQAWERGYHEGGAEFEVDNPYRAAGAGESDG